MSAKSNDRYAQHPLPDDFPISTLGNYRQKIIAPAGPLDAQGSWRQRFGIHSTGAGSSRVGTLDVERRVRGEGAVSLHVKHEKLLTGASGVPRSGPGQPRRVLEAVMQVPAGAGPLSTPRQWSFRTQVLDAQGTVISDLGVQRSAVVRDGELEITTGGGSPRSVPLPGAYTVCWALFDAVARLPREPFEPIHFTLVDHFDQIKPEQELCFRRAIDAEIAGKQLRLFGFDQIGRGVLPWTYFVDPEGRTVVAVSGVETYMLESASAGSG